MLDYIELNKLLSNIGTEVCAAGCHGFLCGQICGCSDPPDELWQEFIDPRTLDDLLLDDCYREIKLLLADTIDHFRSPDFDFNLLLPADDTNLADRVAALAEWCHGFLLGYGTGLDQGLALTAECREILEDFSKICQAGIDEHGNEEDELALIELIEYVRMGALLMYEDLSARDWQTERPGLLH